MIQCILHIDRIPKYNRIGDQAQSTKLILLTLAVAFTYFAASTVAYYARKVVPFFGTIKLR
jgi:hypothetical protein